MESKKYKVKGLTLDDVIDKLTVDMNAINFLKGWRYWDKRNQRLSQSWFNAHPRATEWAVASDLVEEVCVHDWSGLEMQTTADGVFILLDAKSGITLLWFYPDGTIERALCANGGAGHFDEEGRIIIDGASHNVPLNEQNGGVAAREEVKAYTGMYDSWKEAKRGDISTQDDVSERWRDTDGR